MSEAVGSPQADTIGGPTRRDAIEMAGAYMQLAAPSGWIVPAEQLVWDMPEIWIVPYDTAAFAIRGEPERRLVGGGAVAVDKIDGTVAQVGNLQDFAPVVEATRLRRGKRRPRRVSRTVELLWFRIPRRARKHSAALAALTSGGDWSARFPILGILLPLAALLAGLFIGARPFAGTMNVISESLLSVSVLCAIGALGSAFGGWAMVGFAIGDLILWRFMFRAYFTYEPVSISVTVASRTFAVFVLAVVVLGAPTLGRLLAGAVHSRLRRVPITAGAAKDVTYVFVAATLGWLWANAFPYLLRPFFGWMQIPSTAEAIQPLQERSGILLVVLLVAATSGVLLERVGRARPVVPRDWLLLVPLARRSRTVISVSVGIIVLAVLQTLLLTGLLNGTTQWVVTLLLLVSAAALGTFVVPRARAWVRLVTRVPILFRVAVVAVVATAVAWPVVLNAPSNNQPDFLPLVAGVVSGAFLAALLIPRARLGSRAPIGPVPT